MPAEVDRMDGKERFRHLISVGNHKVIGALLAELGATDSKKVIMDSYREEHDTALIHCAKKAMGSDPKKDEEMLQVSKLLLTYGADPNEQDNSKKTVLHWACGLKNVALVKLLLDSGADPSIADGLGFNSLHAAVSVGSLECVRLILEGREEIINKVDENGVTPIITAVQKSDTRVLEALVTSGGDVNVQERATKRTPLHYALYLNKKDIFEFLLNNGADLTKTDHRGTNIVHRCCAIADPSYLKLVLDHNSPSAKKALRMDDSEGATPVIVACQNGNIEQLRMLVEAGAPVANKDKFRRCALHHCVENTDTECAEYLLRSIPSLLTCADEEGLTPLHMAVIAGNIPLIKLLLKRGANLRAVDNEKHTVAHWATVCGHSDVLDVLLENGAELSAPDKHHAYPIHYAAQMMSKKSGSDSGSSGNGGSLQILKTLLKNKVLPEAEDKDNRTPIIWAASAGSPEACRVLVEHGADVNRADKDDLTALHCAASRGHAACVETLIKNCKADVDPVDKNQCTPLFYATTLGHINCIKTLLELGADLQHTDTRGRTASHCATVSGSTEALEILRRNHVDLWARNLKGDQPIHEAAQSGHLDVVQYLLVHTEGQPNAIDSGNTDGRTCLHIAALTNNIWLCKFLLDRQANVNALMKNKGKYYSPYDAALIKGHTEAKDLLYTNNGRPGSAVASHAAVTIQVGYKYHKKRKSRPSTKASDFQKSSRPSTGKKSPSKEQSPAQSREKGPCDREGQKETDSTDSVKKKVDPESNAAAVKNKDTGEEEAHVVETEQNKKQPKYVDKATQITTTVSRKQLQQQRKAASDLPKEQATKESHSKDQDKSTESGSKSPDTKNSQEGGRTEKPTKQTSRDANIVKESPKKTPSDESQADKTSESPKQKQSSNPVQIPTASAKKSPRELGKNQSKTEKSHKKSKTHQGGNTSQSEDEDSQSERSSSHGNTSDVESSSSDVLKGRKVKKSPITRGARYTSKQQRQNTGDKKLTRQKAVGSLDKETKANHKSEKSTPDYKSKSPENKINHSKEEDREIVTQQSAQKSTTEGSETKSSETPSKKSSEGKDTSLSPSKSEDKTETKANTMGSGNTKNRRAAEADAIKNSEINKEMKSNKKNVKYSSSSDGLHLDSDRDQHTHRDDDAVDDKKESPNDDDQGYTDVEDMGGHEISPRRKKTRPNKLIQSIQESVKRYETERKSIRQLHQIRRAQIYSGPVYDVQLFRKIVDNVQSKRNGETTSAENWEEYLQEQMKMIQEERAKSAGVKRGHNNMNNTNDVPDSARSGTARNYPQPHSARRREKTSLEVQTPRQSKNSPHGREQDNSTNSSKSNTFRGNNYSASPRLTRPQTAHGIKVSNSHKDSEVYVTENYYYDNPRKSTSREAMRRRQEVAQQQLIKAYKPFGGTEIFQQSLPGSRSSARGRRPTSTMSSKTGTSVGSAASVRQSRTSGYTIMTSYGSRRIRQAPNVDSKYHPNFRQRNPLIFQDPDSYEKSRRETESRPERSDAHQEQSDMRNGHR